MLMMTFSPISNRPSTVAEAICGKQGDVLQLAQLRIDLRLPLEHVQPGPGQFAGRQHPGQRVLVHHLPAGGVHQISRLLHQLQPTRGQQMERRRRMRRMDGDDVHPRQHLVQALPMAGAKRLLLHLAKPLTVIIVNVEPEGLGAPRDRLADPAHADDAQSLAGDPRPQKGRRGPALPPRVLHHLDALGESSGTRKDQRHGHIGGVLGQNPRRVGDQHAPLPRGRDVDVIDARPEIGDQLQRRSELRDQPLIDLVRHRRHQNIRVAADLDQLRARHRLVGFVQ